MRLEAEEATRAEHLASRKSLAGQRMLGTVEKDSPCAGMCLRWEPGEGGMAARRTALGVIACRDVREASSACPPLLHAP